MFFLLEVPGGGGVYLAVWGKGSCWGGEPFFTVVTEACVRFFRWAVGVSIFSCWGREGAGERGSLAY